ncbi:MAG: pentapeptide repeat-containing protein [Rhodospirillaceae bacterium]
MIMPGKIEQTQILSILLRHRFYVKGDSRGERADLSFRNLSGIVSNKQILTNIILRGANLAGADFSECDLTGADLFGADLEGADLHDAILTGADFRGANLTRAIMTNCQLQGADFCFGGQSGTDRARLTEAKLDRAILCQANFNGCDLSGAELVDADLSGADLSKAILIGAELSGATLINIKTSNTTLELSRLTQMQQNQIGSVDGIINRNFSDIDSDLVNNAIVKHQEWINSNGASGCRFELDGVRIVNVSFKEIDLSGARMRYCLMTGLDLSQSMLNMADLSYSDLSDTNLTRASLKGANMRGINLSRANLCNAFLEAMQLSCNKIWPTNLERSILTDADLTNANLSNAIVDYADFSGCNLQDSNFTNVNASKAKVSGFKLNSTSVFNKHIRTRFKEPKLLIKTAYGIYTSASWSLSGVCLSGVSSDIFNIDSVIIAKVVAVNLPPARDANLIVVKYDPAQGTVLLKFDNMAESLYQYLHSLVDIA